MSQVTLAQAIGSAQILLDSARPADAVALYRGWIAEHGDDPLLHVAWFNLAILLQQIGDLDAATEAFRQAALHDAGFLPPFLSLGVAHHRRGEALLALEHWRYVSNSLRLVTPEAIAMKVAALKHQAAVLEEHCAFPQAEDALQDALALDPRQRDVLQRWVSLRQRRCAWPLLEPLAGMQRADVLRGMAPLSVANYADDPMLHLAIGWACCAKDAPMPAHFLREGDFAAARHRGGRRRIGYLSSDLRDHAIGHLTADLFRLHDRKAFEIFIYDCGIAHDDTTKRRIRTAADHWRDIIAVDDDAALRLMRDDGIDILIDLNGHTRGARPGLLAMRPAPAIVNWLGFPGSMGSPCHNYILADDAVIPPGDERFYSERVLRLPCYQPNDRHRTVAPCPSRAALGLPEDAFVFVSFNGAQKITPFVFRQWMAILRAVPAAVLWLMQGGEAAEAALRARAAEAGLDPGRLVFAPPMRNPDHVARYAAADLFLDTWPYGAHTTASDALWMGVPVLTVPGRSFASRVCASLVRAADLGELVCNDWETYVSRAIALAKDRPRLAGLRDRLLAGRMTSTLFDTGRLVRALEDLYRAIWHDVQAGCVPVPDLANLPAYLDLGAGFDFDDAFPETAAALEARWQAALERRHAFAALPSDQRLWRAPPLSLAAE